MPRGNTSWNKALKQWNLGNTEMFSIPRKGSTAHSEVKEIQSRMVKKSRPAPEAKKRPAKKARKVTKKRPSSDTGSVKSGTSKKRARSNTRPFE